MLLANVAVDKVTNRLNKVRKKEDKDSRKKPLRN